MSRTESQPTDAGRPRRPTGHDRQIDREINLRGVGQTVLGILVLTLVAMAAMWAMLEWMLVSEERRDPEPPALEAARTPQMPPGPRLQASPEAELETYRAHENALLSSYGWQDREAGTVRIPVGRAMELIVAEGRGAMSTAPTADEAMMEEGAATATDAAGEEPGTDAMAAPAAGEGR